MIQTWKTTTKKWFEVKKLRRTINDYIYVRLEVPQFGNSIIVARGYYYAIVNGIEYKLGDFNSRIPFQQITNIEVDANLPAFQDNHIINAILQRSVEFCMIQIAKENEANPETNWGISPQDLEVVEPVQYYSYKEPVEEVIEEEVEEEETNAEE